jgi:hypothetical protein
MAVRALRAVAPAAAATPRSCALAARVVRAASLKDSPRSRQRARFCTTRASATTPPLSEADDTEWRGSNAPLALLKRCDALADPGEAATPSGGVKWTFRHASRAAATR